MQLPNAKSPTGSESGFSLLETVVATCLASIGMLAVMTTAAQSRVAHAMIDAGQALGETEVASLNRLSVAMTETYRTLKVDGNKACTKNLVVSKIQATADSALTPVTGSNAAALVADFRSSPSPVVQAAVDRCLASGSGPLGTGLYFCFVSSGGVGGSKILTEAFLGFADATNGRLVACENFADKVASPVGYVALATYGASSPQWRQNSPVRIRKGSTYVPAR